MSIKVFGVTGTNGKTTTSYMLKNILEASGKSCGLIGTISHNICGKNYEAINTTPGAVLMEKYFEEMKECGAEYCVMEVSSHGLSQGRVDNVEIHYGGFTNLTRDHLDYHRTVEEYYKAKKKLFYLAKLSNVINVDDPYGKRLLDELRLQRPLDVKNFSYSLYSSSADFYGKLRERRMEGSQLEVYEEGRFLGEVQLHLPGDFSAYDGLLAISLARAENIGFEQIKEGLEALTGVPGRFEIIRGTRDFLGVVDYAHTPDALENLLRTVKALKEDRGRLILVFGCGGNRDGEKRQMMGRIAGEYSDYTIITSDNPRNENPEDIAAEIEEGLYGTGCQYHIVIDREKAIKWAVSIFRKGDIIVVAGKGHETSQIVGAEKMPFHDATLIKELI